MSNNLLKDHDLTKRDLVVSVSDQTGFTQKQVAAVIDVLLEKVVDGLAKGGRVSLRELGTLEVKERKAKVGRNPKKPDHEVIIPARATVKFRPATLLQNRVARLLPEIQKHANGLPR